MWNEKFDIQTMILIEKFDIQTMILIEKFDIQTMILIEKSKFEISKVHTIKLFTCKDKKFRICGKFSVSFRLFKG